jgi:hypothetical protein
MKKDAAFLKRMEVMDYSMLVIKRKGVSRGDTYDLDKYELNELPCT